GKDGRSSSFRNTLVNGSACEVGGMSWAATSDTRATDSKITSSCGASISSSASVSSIRANLARFATSSAVSATVWNLLLHWVRLILCRSTRLTGSSAPGQYEQTG